MFVADAGITVWIAGFLLVGVLGFFVMAVALVFRCIGWLFRAMFGGSAARKRCGLPRSSGRRQLACTYPGCGHINGPAALFCGRCGRPLRQTYDVDAYG